MTLVDALEFRGASDATIGSVVSQRFARLGAQVAVAQQHGVPPASSQSWRLATVRLPGAPGAPSPDA